MHFTRIAILVFVSSLFPMNSFPQEELEKPVYEFLNQGELEKAEAKALELIQLHPASAGLHHVYGRALYQKKDYQKSIERIQKSLELPTQPEWLVAWSHFYLGLNYKELKNKEKSIEHLSTAFKMNATRNCANAAAHALKEWGVDVDALSKPEGLSPEDEVYKHANNGALNEAEDAALRAIQSGKASAGLRHAYARVLHQKNEHQKSIEQLNKTLDYSNNPAWLNAWSYFYLGLNHRELKNEDDAVAFLKKAVQVNATTNCTNAALRALQEMGHGLSEEQREQLSAWPHSLKGKPAPPFELTDTNGIAHRSSDYRFVPMVLHFGATWCGGCQAEAAWMEAMSKEYGKNGVVFANVHPGENIAAALDYARHCRSKNLSLIDYDYSVSNSFNSFSWPSTVVIDSSGIIAYHNLGASGDEKNVRSALDQITNGLSIQVKEDIAEPVCEDGVCYIPPLPMMRKTHYDRQARMASDSSHHLWVAFASNRGGDDNIVLRRYVDGVAEEDLVVTRVISDDHSPDIAVASDGRVWIVWVSDRDGKHDIYCRAFADGTWTETMRVTESPDDAFRPRIAVDGKGRVWIAYYQWNRQFQTSRDRDLFVQMYDGERWSAAMEASPPDPKIEDHTDPSIIAASNDEIWVAWSYDYHPQLFDKPLDTDQPSIFAQKVDENGRVGEPVLVGVKGIAHHAVDLFPVLAAGPNDDLVCAWDSHIGQTRSILFSSMKNGGAFENEERLSSGLDLCSTPTLAVNNEGTVHVAWAQKKGGIWTIVGCEKRAGNWSAPTAFVETNATCRNPQLLCDGAGRLWLLYEEQAGMEVNVKVKRIP